MITQYIDGEKFYQASLAGDTPVWELVVDEPTVVNYIVEDIEITEQPRELINNEVSVISVGPNPAVLKLPKNRVSVA